jgi:lipid A 3-O-deacylase
MSRMTVTAVISLILLVVFLTMLTPSKTDAAPPEEKPHKWLREIGLLSGYGSAPLSKKASEYEVIPLLPQFGFDINPLAKKLHIEPKGTFEGMIEPLMNVVTHPDANAEVGCSFFLKYSQKITSRIAPYIEGGLGMIYTTQHTHEQGTQFNFLTQAGAGIHFFLTNQVALTAGYRFRHLSNAGIDDDNEGIDHHFGLVGVSYFFQ